MIETMAGGVAAFDYNGDGLIDIFFTNGAGIPSQFPRLAGQHAQYTADQLKAFRGGARANDFNRMMRVTALKQDFTRLTRRMHQAAMDGNPEVVRNTFNEALDANPTEEELELLDRFLIDYVYRPFSKDDEFEVTDWPGMFKVQSTPFAKAIDETFNDPTYSQVVLEF